METKDACIMCIQIHQAGTLVGMYKFEIQYNKFVIVLVQSVMTFVFTQSNLNMLAFYILIL